MEVSSEPPHLSKHEDISGKKMLVIYKSRRGITGKDSPVEIFLEKTIDCCVIVVLHDCLRWRIFPP